MAYAYAWRSGRIEVGPRVPEGALPIVRGRAVTVMNAMQAMARHAYDGKTLLVPGIPEAASDDAAVDALIGFRDWVAGKLPAPRRRAA